MEIQLVHTTGSPSRHDSDSESSYDKKRQIKSSSDMALHRKQSRRCKKQMSERQRRKRMNNFMDKLGLLVYGKTFKDGLKVDKATLLKDAYERLQTMKDDYHKGYKTAMTSIQTFLDTQKSCPQDIKDAVIQHLEHRLHRCQSSRGLCPPEESSSDSWSPQPVTTSASEVNLGQEFQLDTGHVSSAYRPKSCRRVFTTPTPSVSGERLAGVSARFATGRESSLCRPHQKDRGPSSPATEGADTVPVSVCPGNDVCNCRHDDVTRVGHATSPLGTPFSLLKPSSSRSQSSWGLAANRSIDPHSAGHSSWGVAVPRSVDPPAAGQERSVSGLYPPPTFPFPYLSNCPSPSTPCSSSMPKISPYITPFAPQSPLYLGSTPLTLLYRAPTGSSTSGLVCGVPETTPSSSGLSSHQHPPLNPLSAYTPHFAGHPPTCYGNSSRADDSGYMSPMVPSPLPALSVAQYGGVKKWYLKEMMTQQYKDRAADDTDENDKEVEQVFSRAASARCDSDLGSTPSD